MNTYKTAEVAKIIGIHKLSYEPKTNIRGEALNAAKKDAEIITVCDELMDSLIFIEGGFQFERNH